MGERAEFMAALAEGTRIAHEQRLKIEALEQEISKALGKLERAEEQLTEARDDLQCANEDLVAKQKDIDALCEDVYGLSKQCEKLRLALERYGKHDDTCPRGLHPNNGCTCGLDVAAEPAVIHVGHGWNLAQCIAALANVSGAMHDIWPSLAVPDDPCFYGQAMRKASERSEICPKSGEPGHSHYSDGCEVVATSPSCLGKEALRIATKALDVLAVNAERRASEVRSETFARSKRALEEIGCICADYAAATACLHPDCPVHGYCTKPTDGIRCDNGRKHAGPCTPLTLKQANKRIDDRISAWHASDSTMKLYEYLGWTAEEYSAWVQDPNAIPERELVREFK